MKLWNKLKKHKNKDRADKSKEAIENIQDDGAVEVLHRDQIDLRDGQQRGKFVKSALDQIKDAETAIAQLTKEYSIVTSYLTDMEEIEALPPEEKSELVEIAEKITAAEKEKVLYEGDTERLSEDIFRQIERMEEEVTAGIAKLSEAEDFQEKIHGDMKRLSGEQHAYRYRKHELQNTMVNMRGILIVVFFAFLTCVIILAILQSMLRMEVSIGYMAASAATALAVFFTYMKYMDAAKEKKKVEKAINRLILLLNRVKIRYVNNTNLLEYLQIKYKVNSSKELENNWVLYQKEKEEREKFKELHAELDFQQKELLRILRRFQIKDPEIWLRQTEAICNHNEMVEIRHSLILRRQKLRKQMEYNEKLAENGQMEIRSLAEEYPTYGPEIMKMVSDYEEKR